MAALPNDPITNLLKSTNGVLEAHAGDLRHTSDRHFGLADLKCFRLVGLGCEPTLSHLPSSDALHRGD